MHPVKAGAGRKEEEEATKALITEIKCTHLTYGFVACVLRAAGFWLRACCVQTPRTQRFGTTTLLH